MSKEIKFVLVDDDEEESEESDENLKIGTTTGKIPVTLTIDGVKNTYASIRAAARETGIAPTTIRGNIKRKRSEESDESESDESESDESESDESDE